MAKTTLPEGIYVKVDPNTRDGDPDSYVADTDLRAIVDSKDRHEIIGLYVLQETLGARLVVDERDRRKVNR